MRLFFSGFSNRDYWKRWGERFGHVNIVPVPGPRVLVHAVSVGEVQAAVPFVKRLQEKYPGYDVMISTTTPTGSAMVRQKFGDDIKHCYLPYDLPHCIKRFLNLTCPVLMIVMETEIWPNLYYYCKKKDIKVVLANGRMSEKSFIGYKRFDEFIREVTSGIDHIAAQTAGDAQRFIELGALPEKVTITGSLKFDVDPVIKNGHERSLKTDFFHGRPTWIAASTHQGEEDIVLQAHKKVMEQFPQALCILAPRHPERSSGLPELCKSYGFDSVRKSRVNSCADSVQVFILDVLGELINYYVAADVALVGGSLLPAYGGHNVLEPASLGVPVITGKYTRNFEDITRLLCDNGASVRVTDETELAEKLLLLLADGDLRKQMGQAAHDIVINNRGSTDKLMNIVERMMGWSS